MDQTDENLTPAELLETAEILFEQGDGNRSIYRASVLEAITALEANVKAKVFSALQVKIGEELTNWLEEKTRMDFETRLSLFIPIATGLKVNKKDRLWGDYKKAKEIRNKVTHSGKNITRPQARSVIDTVYEWMEYLNQAQQSQTQSQENKLTSVEILGKFIQASARLERVIYTTAIKDGSNRTRSSMKLNLEELRYKSLINDTVFQELNELRSIRNKAIHGRSEDIVITQDQVDRLNKIVDQIEAKQK